MNLNFQGTKVCSLCSLLSLTNAPNFLRNSSCNFIPQYNLGERYTDLTKVLFMCFYYSALYPAAFFFGTAILIVQYHVSQNFALEAIA